MAVAAQGRKGQAAQTPQTGPKPEPGTSLAAYGGLKVFSGNANPKLAEEICGYLKIKPGKVHVGRFADGEIHLQVNENVRGSDCYVIQPTCRPVNENLIELLMMIDALRRASAGRITAVLPYYGYARADRKTEPRVPISAKLMANLITTSGADRVIALDLHVGQIQGFFDIPVDHLYGTPVFLDYIRKKGLKDLVAISPDVGGVERARAFAKRLNAGLVIIDKRRPRPNEASVYNVIGDVAGRNCVILDDMVDTAGTLTKVADAIKEKGALRVFAAATHGVLSGNALDRIQASSLEELVLTNSMPIHAQGHPKIKVLSVAPILGEAIRRNHFCQSISELFI